MLLKKGLKFEFYSEIAELATFFFKISIVQYLGQYIEKCRSFYAFWATQKIATKFVRFWVWHLSDFNNKLGTILKAGPITSEFVCRS